MTESNAGVAAAISAAARLTGVSARYLTATAQRESAFDPAAQAETSSASGLYQFIESTWLSTLERHGEQLGLGEHLGLDRAETLALRFDPGISALLAGALTADNAEALESRLGRPPSEGELYAAHVLGAGGASRLIEAAAENPAQAADALMPAAAGANRGLFYDPAGDPVSAAALLERFSSMMTDTIAPSAFPAAFPAAFEAAAPRVSFSAPPRIDAAPSALNAGGSWARSTPLHLTPTTIEILAALEPPERADDST
ncbi:MAG: transglycosylase SLT domain-containing protein [Maricaulaceae bacterium]|jgi:hypothetical protein